MKKQIKKMRIIVILISMIMICAISVLYKYNAYNNSAKSEINSINILIHDNKYLEAYNRCKSYKYKKYGNYNEVRKIIDKLNIIADEKYIKGIKILEKDKGNNYSEAINYFSKYNEEFKYSDERCKESKEIIKLIDDYTKCQDELNSKMPVVTYYEENNKIIKNIESYIESFDYFRDIINVAIDNRDLMNMYNVYTYWNNNRDYYYSMKEEISNLYNNLGENSIFYDEDMQSIYEYIDNGIMPGEYIEKYIKERKITSSDKNDFINKYTDYVFLKDRVTNMLTRKKEILTETTREVKETNDKMSKIDEEIIKLCNY